MFPAARAILVEFDPVWIVAPVFLRHIISFFALITCQVDDRADVFLFRSHAYLTTLLFYNFGNDTRADGETAFTDGELGALFESHGYDQFHGQVDVVTRQYHLYTLG
jgi:hypothetical protein